MNLLHRLNNRTGQDNLVNADSAGPTGPTGPTGPQGPQGPTGAVEAIPVTNILYVDGNRGDSYTPDGSMAKPFKKIQDAIDAVVSPSATNKYLIDIAPGAYYSDALAINKIYVTFRSCGVQGARISGHIVVTNPSDPTPEQITFSGLRISGGLECYASHIAINAIGCNITGSDWVFAPTVPTDDEYLQVWGGLWYVNATLTGVYSYLMGGGFYSTFTVTDKEFNINNADLNDPFEALLSGTVIGSAFGNRASNTKFTLNTGANLHIDADTEGGSVITMAGGTLTRSTKSGNLLNDSSVAGETVKDALETLASPLPPERLIVEPLAFESVQYFNGTTYTDLTDKAKTNGGIPFNILAATNNYFYVGFYGRTFVELFFDIVTAGVGVTLKIEYYNGAIWTDVNLLDDTSVNLSQKGTIRWNLSGDEATVVVNGFAGYFVRLSTTTLPSITPTSYIASPWEYVLGVPAIARFSYPDYHGISLRANGDTSIEGELKIKVYSQTTEPELNENNNMAIWIDTSDSNRVWLMFRRGAADIVAVELA